MRPRSRHPSRLQVDPNDPAALQARELRHDLAHQPQANHNHVVTQADAGDPDGIQGDASERRETGQIHWD
jgi:hypothetical protein